jgi:hypothetical protein
VGQGTTLYWWQGQEHPRSPRPHYQYLGYALPPVRSRHCSSTLPWVFRAASSTSRWYQSCECSSTPTILHRSGQAGFITPSLEHITHQAVSTFGSGIFFLLLFLTLLSWF